MPGENGNFCMFGLNHSKIYRNRSHAPQSVDIATHLGSKWHGQCSLPIRESNLLSTHIQGDSGGKVSVLGGDSIGYCEKESSYERVYNYEWLRR
jgi:hypothetical protein